MLATKRKSRAFTFLTLQVSTVLTILPRRAGSTLLLVRWDSNLTINDRKKGNVLNLIPRFNSAEMVDVNGSLAIRILPQTILTLLVIPFCLHFYVYFLFHDAQSSSFMLTFPLNKEYGLQIYDFHSCGEPTFFQPAPAMVKKLQWYFLRQLNNILGLHLLFIFSFSLHFLAARLPGSHKLCHPGDFYILVGEYD